MWLSLQNLPPALLNSVVLCCAGLSSYPLFMQEHWFQPGNASALRAHIKTIILELFIQQVRHPTSPSLCMAGDLGALSRTKSCSLPGCDHHISWQGPCASLPTTYPHAPCI